MRLARPSKSFSVCNRLWIKLKLPCFTFIFHSFQSNTSDVFLSPPPLFFSLSFRGPHIKSTKRQNETYSLWNTTTVSVVVFYRQKILLVPKFHISTYLLLAVLLSNHTWHFVDFYWKGSCSWAKKKIRVQIVCCDSSKHTGCHSTFQNDFVELFMKHRG